MTYPGRKKTRVHNEVPPDRPEPSVEDWFARNISGAGFWEWYVEQVDPDRKEQGILPNRGRGLDKPKVK